MEIYGTRLAKSGYVFCISCSGAGHVLFTQKAAYKNAKHAKGQREGYRERRIKAIFRQIGRSCLRAARRVVKKCQNWHNKRLWHR